MTLDEIRDEIARLRKVWTFNASFHDAVNTAHKYTVWAMAHSDSEVIDELITVAQAMVERANRIHIEGR